MSPSRLVHSSFQSLAPSDRRRFIWLVLARMCSHGLDVVAIAGVALLAGALTAAPTFLAQVNIIGFELEFRGADGLLFALGIVVGLFVLKSLLAGALARETFYFLAAKETEFAVKVASYIFNGPILRIQEFSKGRMHWALNSSVLVAISTTLGAAATLLVETSLALLLLVVLAVLEPLITLVLVIYLGALAGVLQFVLSPRLTNIGRQLANKQIMVTDTAYAIADAAAELSLSGKKESFLSNLASYRRAFAFNGARQRFLQTIPRYFIEVSVLIGLFVLAAALMLTTPIGEALSVLGVFLVGSFRLIGAILPIQTSYNSLRLAAPQASEALSTMQDAGVAPTEESMGPRQAQGSNYPLGVSMKNASFKYPAAKRRVFERLDVEIEPGTFVFVRGPSGAGKTTFGLMSLGLLPPTEGRILIDGEPASTFRFHNPGRLGYVPQQPRIFNASLEENIALGVPREDIDRRAVEECLARADLSSLVQELPEKIETLIGPASHGLSVGQVQRLGVARALYTKPGLLVFDEPTSALDTASSKKILSLLSNLAGPSTVIVISHGHQPKTVIDQEIHLV